MRFGPAPLVTTDIHTHLTGAPASAELIRLGLLHDVRYPAAMVRHAGLPLPDGVRLDETELRTLPGGIAAPAHGSFYLRLRDLPRATLGQLATAMQMPPRPAGAEIGGNFMALERAYSIRRPLAADPVLLPGILRSVAADAARDGVRHLELSASAPLLAPAAAGHHWMAEASRVAADIRRDSLVSILFLATVNRHASPPALANALAQLDELLSAWPLLVGVDVAGHEINSTQDFMPQVVAWASARTRRGLPAVVRVHAGETAAHPGNVRTALEGFRQIGLPPGMGRIGHALYGVGRREVTLAQATGAVIEMNIASNLALGYRSAGRSGGGARLVRLIQAGVAVVLGTDGNGIYGAGSAAQVRHALDDGATPAALAEVARHENAHLARMAAAFGTPQLTPG